ncbi:MAG: TonB-dependent receptor, partial [Prevotella sp.]|nr:TonB-dependent receptor [Prevotella sp.]
MAGLPVQSLAQHQPTLEINGQLIDANQNDAIPFATVIVMTADSAFIKGGITDTLGNFNIACDISLPFMLRITCIGYEGHTQLFNDYNVGKISLTPSIINIAEVEISPDEVQDFITHRIYRPSVSKIKSFDNFLQSLSTIPTLKVHSDKLYTIDGKQVKILLNGANATETDLIALPPESIGKIEVYENPPTRFALQGITSVVNIRTKSDISGGNMHISTNNAITTHNGDNLLSVSYNKNKARFTAEWSNLYRDVMQFQDEKISYKFNNTDYTRNKLGIESPFKWNLNNIKLGVSYTKPDDLQVNTTFYINLNRRNENTSQRIKTAAEDCIAAKTSHNRYNMYAADLYISKRLNVDNELLFNLIGSAYDSKLATGYTEMQTETLLFESLSDVIGQKQSLIADAQYQHTMANNMVYTLGAYDFIENSNYSISSDFNTSMRNNAWLYADATASIKGWHIFLRIGLNHAYFRSSEQVSFSNTYISPQARITYYPSQWSAIFVSYTMDNAIPSLSMLSETPIWYDYHYAFQGNSNLKPYTKHDFLLGGYWASPYAVCAWNLSYEHSPNAFMPYFTPKDNFIAETYSNMRLLQSINAVLQLDLQPLGNERIRLMVSGMYCHKVITGIDFDWTHNAWRIIPEIEFNYKKWRATLLYQPGQELADGQLLRRSPRATRAEVGYRFPFNLNLALGGKYLFDKDWRDGYDTHPSALVQR